MKTYLSGEFERLLRRLNKDIRVFCSDDDSKPAGVFLVTKDGQYEEICGIDKNWIPEGVTWDDSGHIVKSGWRRVIDLLLRRRLVTKAVVRQVIPDYIRGFKQAKAEVKVDEVLAAQSYLEQRAAMKGRSYLVGKDFSELAALIREKNKHGN